MTQLLFFRINDGTRKVIRKKKQRRPKGVEKSSGDSDSQTLSEDAEGHVFHRRYEDHHRHDGHHHHDGHLKKPKQVRTSLHRLGKCKKAN